MTTKDPALRISANPKSFFLYLLAVIALYTSLWSFIGQVFDYINIALPDPATRAYFDPISSIRWNIAVLIIAFPVYLFLFCLIRREYLQFPEQKELMIRKWAAYLTIFVASTFILGDAIALIYSFLNGALTLRFLLKILVIFIVFIGLFHFTLRDLKQPWQTTTLKIIGWGTTFIVVAAMVYGLSITGSPFKARLAKFDRQRIVALNIIQGEIIKYLQQKNKLPNNLSDLTDNIAGFRAPVDPQTGHAYEYKALSKLSFELCATFSLPSGANSDKLNPSYYPSYPLPQETWNWQHDKGRYCFQRVIDPQRYLDSRKKNKGK